MLQYNACNRDSLTRCTYTAKKSIGSCDRAFTTWPADRSLSAVPYVHLQIAWVLTFCRYRWSISCSARCVYVYCASALSPKSLAARDASKARAKKTVESTSSRWRGHPNLSVATAILASDAISDVVKLPIEKYRYHYAILDENCRVYICQ